MQRRLFKYFSLFAVGSLAAVALVGCGTFIQDPEPSSGADAETNGQLGDKDAGDEAATNASSSAGDAVLSYGDTIYTADLQFCSLQGGEDALFHGVAYDESGEAVGYLDGDFGNLSDLPYGEVRIDLGAIAQFESTDAFMAMGVLGSTLRFSPLQE